MHRFFFSKLKKILYEQTVEIFRDITESINSAH